MADSKINPVSLDTTLDDIEDLPSFECWLTGAYIVNWSFEPEKKIGENPNYTQLNMKLKEVKELGEPETITKTRPNPGDTINMLFDRSHKVGAAKLAEAMECLEQKFGKQTKRELMKAAEGLDILVVIKRDVSPATPATATTPAKPEKEYPRLKTAIIL